MVNSTMPRLMRRTSPSWTIREDLARLLFTCTLPPLTAWAARVRVLKNLAAHNHLSSRTCLSGSVTSLISTRNSLQPIETSASHVKKRSLHRISGKRMKKDTDHSLTIPELPHCRTPKKRVKRMIYHQHTITIYLYYYFHRIRDFHACKRPSCQTQNHLQF